MKKLLAIFLTAMLMVTALSSAVFAMDAAASAAAAADTEAKGAPEMGGYTQDADGLSSCYSDYIKYYIPGISADTRETIKAHVAAGYNDGSIQMMSMMTGFASIRKAGQAAEATENQVNGTAPSVDVIRKYYSLTDEQKAFFADNITAGFAAVGLDAAVTDGVLVITKAGADFASIKLVTEKPKSATRIYLEAYIPGLPADDMTAIENFVVEYGAEGGAPAGSGAVWRCIREIGQFMGVEAESVVDTEAGTMSVNVIKEGTMYLADCTDEVIENVMAKVLMLDEPTTYLDICHQIEILELLKDLNARLGLTIVMVLHDLAHAARYSHKVVILKDGDTVVSGKPQEVLTRELIRDVYKVDAYITNDEKMGGFAIFPFKIHANTEVQQ